MWSWGEDGTSIRADVRGTKQYQNPKDVLYEREVSRTPRSSLSNAWPRWDMTGISFLPLLSSMQSSHPFFPSTPSFLQSFLPYTPSIHSLISSTRSIHSTLSVDGRGFWFIPHLIVKLQIPLKGATSICGLTIILATTGKQDSLWINLVERTSREHQSKGKEKGLGLDSSKDWSLSQLGLTLPFQLQWTSSWASSQDSA